MIAFPERINQGERASLNMGSTVPQTRSPHGRKGEKEKSLRVQASSLSASQSPGGEETLCYTFHHHHVLPKYKGLSNHRLKSGAKTSNSSLKLFMSDICQDNEKLTSTEGYQNERSNSWLFIQHGL
jgi:hypothetical protein